MVKYDKNRKYWYYEYTEKRTRRHIKKTGFRTKADAVEAEYQRKKDSGVEGKIKYNRSLYPVIEEKLLDIKVHNPISTYSTFESLYRLHIKDILVNKPIRDYDRMDINIYMEKLIKLGRTPNTANKVKSFLVNVFNFALENNYITYNPILNLKNMKCESKEVAYWDYEMFLKAMKAEDDYEFKMFIEFCYYCGIRKGERIFTWRDVDFKKGTVLINKHLYETGNTIDNMIILKGRKNNSSLTITLNKTLKDDLFEYKKYCEKFDGYSEDWYVFGMQKPLARTTITNKLDKLCKKAGVRRITPHGLRHSMASAGYNGGLESQLIAARLGDTVEQVYQTYGHLKPNADKVVADYFDKLENKMEEKNDN